MTTRMTLSDDDWTHEENARGFADQEEPNVALAAADTVEAWLVNNVHAALPGWSYGDGTFDGPYIEGAYDVVSALINEAIDYTISCLDELREEYGSAA